MVIHTAHGPVTIKVEVADTPDARAHGLMYRRDLAADAGMLFVFAKESDQQFWMKNTPLPLDMVFIGADRRIVGVVADTRPFSTNSLGVSKPSQYVLEVNGGFCAKHGVAAGDVLEFFQIGEGAEDVGE